MKAKKRKALAVLEAEHRERMRAGECQNSFGVKTFLTADSRHGVYEAQAECYGLRVVEYFCGLYATKDDPTNPHSPVEEDMLLLLNDAGECFVYLASAGNHTKPVTLAESVRLYAGRLNDCSESGPGPAFQDWLEAVAQGLEKRGAL